MSAADKFKNASTDFGADRVKALPPIYRQEKDDKGQTKEVFEADGLYEAEIIRCLWVKPRKGPDLYIAEFTVTKSNNPKVQVGSRWAFKQNMENEAANTRVTEFLFACCGLDRRNPEDLEVIKSKDDELPELLAETLDDPTDESCKNSLKGDKVRIEVAERVAKNGFPYKHYSFFPVQS